MLLQRRDAPAPRLSRTAARLPKALDPDNRRAGTDIKLLGRRAPRRPAFNFRNHSRPHVFRIGLLHRPASQHRINADRLSHPSPSENLLDSIGTEHALAHVCAPIARLPCDLLPCAKHLFIPANTLLRPRRPAESRWVESDKAEARHGLRDVFEE